MCEVMNPCALLKFPPQKLKKLTMLLLDCWQREYDKRPYRHFKFNINEFENRMERKYRPFRDFVVIVKFLQRRTLCTINLSGIHIFERFPKLVEDFCNSLKNLRSIILKQTDLPRRFFELLNQHAPNMRVKELELEGSILDDYRVEHLWQFLLKAPSMSYLNVGFCDITQFNFALIADGVYKSRTIKRIDVTRILGLHLSLDTEKISNTMGSLLWQNKLEEITLRHCEFLAQDMAIFAEYISDPCSRLKKLDISCNKIAADGAELLMAAVAKGGTMKHLNMSFNTLGAHGGQNVAHWLSSCPNLEVLSLKFNDIDPDGVNMILLANKKPVKLTRLELWGNKYDSKSSKTLRRLIDSTVIPQESIDITYTYDDVLQDYRIIPYL